MRVFRFMLVALLLADVAYGASLAGLQQMALQNRQIIQKYLVNLQRDKKDETIAESAYYPSVDVSYTLNTLKDPSPFENRENSIAYGAVSLNLFNGFRDKYNLRSARLLSRAQNYKLQGIKQDIQLNVALRYLAVFDRKAKLNVAKDRFNLLGKLYQDAENRKKVGLIDKNELLKFKVDLDDANITLKKDRAELAKSVALLNREAESRVAVDELSLKEFSNMPHMDSPEKYEQEMLAHRSEIKFLKENAQAAAIKVKARRSLYYPKVDLVGSYRKSANDYLNETTDAYNTQELRGQLVLSMNLFDGFSKSAQVDKAELEVQAIHHDLAELKRDLKTNLHNLFLDYQVSLENTGVAQGGIDQAEENLRITRLKYKEGLQTESDLLDAIANLSRAKYNYVAAATEVFANYFQITRMAEKF